MRDFPWVDRDLGKGEPFLRPCLRDQSWHGKATHRLAGSQVVAVGIALG